MLRPIGIELLEDRVVPANHVWTGAVSGSWNNGGNWADGIIPGAGGETGITLSFGTVAGAKAMMDDIQSLKVDSIMFSATGYSLAGTSSTFTLTGAVSPTISDSVGGNSITGTMVLGSNTDAQISIAANGTDTISAIISDSSGNTGGIVKVGSGTLVLSGNSTYTGLTTINNGVLRLGLNVTASGMGPLGASGAASGTVINSGGTLDFGGFKMQATIGTIDSLLINGSGFNGLGALANSSSNAVTYLGGVTLGANSSIVDSNGILTFVGTGSVTNAGFSLTLDGVGVGTLAAPITGAGSLVKTGTGSWLVQAAASTFTGGTTIAGGTLKVSSPGTAPNGPLGTTAVGVVVNSGGALDLNAVSLANHYPLTLNGGALTNTGALAATFSGFVTLGTSVVFANSGAIVLTGVVSGAAAGITMNGPAAASSLTLAGLNTYSGGTTLSGGTLTVTGNGTLGAAGSALVLNNASTVNATTLNLASANPFLINNFTETLAPGAVAKINNTGATVTFNLTAAATLPSVFTGTGAFNYAVAPGVAVTLSGNSTNTGGVFVSSGTLALGSSAALGVGSTTLLGSDSKTTVSPGATLDLAGQTNVNEVLKIAGTGIGGNGALVNSSVTPASLATNGAIADLILTSGGSGYSAPAPAVTISDAGGGAGASATAFLGVSSATFTLTPGTTTYTVAPTVVISGGGPTSGATAVASLDSSGHVNGITIVSPGVGYTTAPNLGFSGGTVLASGTAPTAASNAINFVVSELLLTAAGANYTAATTITIAGNATAAAQPAFVQLTADSSIGGAGNITIPSVTGSFGLTKVGGGILTLTGPSTYAGPTTVSAGVLNVNGSLAAASDVTVAAGATLGGSGTVSGAVADSGVINPGTAGTTGTLTFDGGVSFAPSSAVDVDVSGSGSDELIVAGKVVISSTTLNVFGTSPSAASYTILHDSAGISGQFLNAPNGTTIVVDGQTYVVNYTGTDVVLTLPSPLVFTSPAATTFLTGVGGSFALAADGSGPITFSDDPGDTLPPGMTFAGGVLSGTPTALGVFTLHLTATNATASATQTLTVTVDPALLVTSTFDSALYAIDSRTGALVKTLIASNTSQDLVGPAGAVLGPDGNLYVSSQGAVVSFGGPPVLVGDKVLQINPSTGEVNTFLDTDELDAVAGIPVGGHFFPAGLAFGPDGNLYVSQNGGQASATGEVVRFGVANVGGVLHADPNPADAVVIAAFGSTTELVQPAGLVFGIAQGDTNNLYVANSPLGEVDKITGATGPTPVLSIFVPNKAGAGAPYVIPGQNPGDPPLTQPYSGLSFPAGLVFGPDGKLYVSDLAAVTEEGNVLRINSDGSVDSIVFTQMNASQQGTLHAQFPYGLQFDDQGNLLTADLGANQNVPLPGSINEYAPSGVFVKTLVSPASFPMGIAPGTATLDVPRQSTVYVSADNFGLTGTLIYGATIPAGPETGGLPAVFGVNAFSSITAALDAMSTSGTVFVSAGTYHEAPTLIATETLTLLGNVTANSVLVNAGTTLDLNGFTLTTGPSFTSPSNTIQLTGVGNSFMVVATAAGSGGAITYSENPSDTLPPGMTFAGGVLSGTPTSLGVYTLHLTATNAVASVNQTLKVTVDPALLVTSTFDSALYAIDSRTGALVKTLIASNTSQDLIGPAGAVLGPDGNLYVSSQGAVVVIGGQAVLVGDKVLQINPSTGAVNTFLDTDELDAVAGIPSGGHFFPAGLAFGPDGNLYVSQNGGQASSTGEVVRFGVSNIGGVLHADPNAADAVVVAAFGATTELVQPAGLVFGISQGDTNNLYVANSPLGEVDKITGATGPTPVLTTFVPAGAGAGAPYVIPGQNPGDPPLTQPYSGLSFPAGLAFGPDGKLYVSDLAAVTNDGNVLRINSDGSVDSVVFAQMNASQQGTLHEQFPYGLQFDDQGNLLTADLGANQNVPLPGSINEYAPNGAFVKTLVSPASFPMGIAPGTAILDMPRQTTVYVASDNFGLTGQLTYGATIPASPETGGQQAVFGVNAFSSITAALDAMSTTGTVIVNGGGYVDSPTLIGAETLRLLGNVTLFDIDTNAGTTVDLQGNTLTMIGKNNGSHTVAGSIKGIGGSLMKVGNDPLTLNGANTYTGPTAVANGALIVNGSLSASSTVSITGNGILGGTGFVGKVINNGVVNPGSPGAPGILTIAGDLTFGPGTLVLDLAANGSDRVNDTGPTIDITGTTLSLNVGTITPNEKFTILVTPGDITGRFANLPTTGSSFTVGSLTFTINYDAGVGDDATVTLQASGGNPSLVGTLLNGGINYVNSALATHQHSMVENVVYSFTQAVSLSASNFTLSGIQGTPPSLVPNVSVSGSGMLWTVSFTGAGVNAATNSIADGEFELVLSGVAGMATSTYDFFRLLGDMDGNGTVDTSDFATLVSTFLRASTDPLYLGADDFDGDNTIGTSDFAEFTGNFLKTLPAPLPN